MLISLKEIAAEHHVQLAGVLHLGAHHGQEASDYADHNATKVIWVEGNPDIMDLLHQNLTKYKNQKAYNFLISDVDGATFDFNITNNEQSSSILELGTHAFRHPEVKNVETKQLTGKRLDRFIEEERIDTSEFNFLNIDLQGAELIALKSLGKYLEDFKYIYTEININHLYKDCPLLHDLDSFLYQKGFIRTDMRLTPKGKGWGDALYTRQKVSKSQYMSVYLGARKLESKQIAKDAVKRLKIRVKKMLNKS